MDESFSPEVARVRFASIDVVFFIETSWSDEFEVKIEGHMRDVFDRIVRALNTSYVIYRMLDNQLGKNKGPDHWTGLIGSLYRNETDVSLCPIPVTIDNIEVLDFTIPVIIQRWSLLSGQPLRIETHFLATLSIFDERIWICLLVTMLTLPLVLAVVRVLTGRMFPERVALGPTYSTYLFRSLGVLLRQSRGLESRPIGVRMAFLPWILAAFLLTSSYTGVLLSKLTLPDQPRQIQKLRDLLGHPEINIYILEDTPVESLIENANDPEMVDLRAQLRKVKNLGVSKDLLPEILTGVDEVLNGRAVAIGLEDAILQGSTYFLTDSNDIYTFYLSPVSVLDEIYSFAYRKHLDADIKDKFDRLMMAYSRSGIIPRAILEATFRAKQWQEIFEGDESQAEKGRLAFKSLRFAFGFCFIGLLLSLSAFVYECPLFVENRIRRRRRGKSKAVVLRRKRPDRSIPITYS